MVTLAELEARLKTVDAEIAKLKAWMTANPKLAGTKLPDLSKLETERKRLVAEITDVKGVTAAPALSSTSFSATLREMGVTGPMEADRAKAEVVAVNVVGMMKEIGLSKENLEKFKKSPIDRSAAAALATSVSTAAQVGLGLLYSIGVMAEAASLGQMETVVNMIDGVLRNMGIDEILKPIFSAPFSAALTIPTRQYWMSVFAPEIPGAGDLIRFTVREVIKPEDFKKWMRFQGFDSAWSDAYWEAHWVLPARDEVVEAYHRKLISKEEYLKYIVWHDYKPTVRPGISKSDMEILAGLMKTLIPRVDLRRAWADGLIDDARLLRGYEDLGYEEDAKIMAEIQKALAVDAERTAVARAAGRIFRDALKSIRKRLDDKAITQKAAHYLEADEEKEFRAVLTEMKMPGARQDLWVRRYRLEAQTAVVAWEEAEELFGAGAEEEY